MVFTLSLLIHFKVSESFFGILSAVANHVHISCFSGFCGLAIPVLQILCIGSDLLRNFRDSGRHGVKDAWRVGLSGCCWFG